MNGILTKYSFCTFIAKVKNKVMKKIKQRKSDKVVTLNFDMRSLTKALIYRQTIRKGCNFVEISGDLFPISGGKRALLTVDFFDEGSNQVQMEKLFNGFKSNANFDAYIYIDASIQHQFKFVLVLPETATTFCLRIKNANNSVVKLEPGASLFQFKFNYKNELQKILPKIEKKRLKRDYTEDFFNKITSSLGTKEKKSLLTFLIDYYWDIDYIVAYRIGMCKLRETKSLHLAQKIKMLINHNGEMKLLVEYIDEVNKLNIPGWKVSSRRIVDDIHLSENGFKFSKNQDRPIYERTKNVFYLLHNSLPYNSGGYATRTHGLLKSLNKSVYTVSGLSRPGFPSDHKKHISTPLPKLIPDHDDIDNVRYFRCSQKTRKSSLTLSEYVEVYSEQICILSADVKPSIIHAASNHPNGLAAIQAARKLGIKSVYEVRGLWEITRLSRQSGWDKTEQFKFMGKMEAEAAKNADAVLTITHALKNIMVERGVAADKISIVPNCVNIADFTPFQPKQVQLLDQLHIDKENIVIGYVGSIVNYEGLDDLIRSLSIVVNKGYTNFKLLIIGDGAYLSHLVDLVKSSDLEKYVIFTGRIPYTDVDDYYSLIDITPFPRKPFLVCEAVSPLKPFEALASGKAVIVSSCDALTEIIEDDVNGLVFDKGDTADLARKLIQLIDDKELRLRLSKTGYDWVVKERDWSVSAKIVESVYDSLLKPKGVQ